MHILEHPALGPVHPEAVQRRIDGMPRRYVAHTRVPESSVARLEFRHQAVDFLLEYFRFSTREDFVPSALSKRLPIHSIHRGMEVLGLNQSADSGKDLCSLFQIQTHCPLIPTDADASPMATYAAQ